MGKIKKANKSNVFGALKLIEQLYLDNQIPGLVFRNIIKEYSDVVSVTSFNCYKEKALPKTR